MGWDLPPGVTGREDVFGEKGSFTAERQCGTEGVFRIYSATITSELEALARDFPRQGRFSHLSVSV